MKTQPQTLPKHNLRADHDSRCVPLSRHDVKRPVFTILVSAIRCNIFLIHQSGLSGFFMRQHIPGRNQIRPDSPVVERIHKDRGPVNRESIER
jgi:hypothetical protein